MINHCWGSLRLLHFLFTILVMAAVTVSENIYFLQINLQHSRAPSSDLCKQFAGLTTAIACIQEPWIHGDKVLGLGSRGTYMHHGSLDKGVRACILVRGLESVNLIQFGTKDQTADRVEYTKKGGSST
jgi:hypothetical protein